MKMSIVIPCYNEEKNIPLILERFKKIIEKEDIEIILVNNGSTDNSAVVLEKLLFNCKFARSVNVTVNQGYGYGIMQGLKKARGEFIGWLHADLQTDPNDALKAYKILEKNNWNKNLYIKGRRKKREPGDKFFSLGMSIFETFYLGKILTDINAQPNIFHRSFFKKWKNPPKDFSLDLYALYMAKKLKLKIIRINVIFPKRIYGKSSWNTGLYSKIKLSRRTLEFSKKLKKQKIK